jgi:hypothetical protein
MPAFQYNTTSVEFSLYAFNIFYYSGTAADDGLPQQFRVLIGLVFLRRFFLQRERLESPPPHWVVQHSVACSGRNSVLSIELCLLPRVPWLDISFLNQACLYIFTFVFFISFSCLNCQLPPFFKSLNFLESILIFPMLPSNWANIYLVVSGFGFDFCWRCSAFIHHDHHFLKWGYVTFGE